MSNFDNAFAVTIKLEGGFQINPNDKGNFNSLNELVGTNHGISAPLYEQVLRRPPSESDMRSLTEQGAKNIYEALFWDKYFLGNITDQFTATHIFDMFVNHGSSGGTGMIQDSLNTLGFNLVRDSNWGSQTRGAVNEAINRNLDNNLNDLMVANRIQFYRNIVKRDPSQEVFLLGWLRRALRFLTNRAPTAILIFLALGTLAFLL